MTCHHVPFGIGGHAIVCTPGVRPIKCSKCGKLGDFLCDWKVKGQKSDTCDKPICFRCTHKPARGKDLCPEHAAEWQARTTQEALK